MKVLVTGVSGQLGHNLQATAPVDVDCIGVTRSVLDLTNSASITQTLSVHQPDIVINAAAYTAVDRAESEVDQAVAVNERGVNVLSELCASLNIPVVQVSTDFVFDGTQSSPIHVDAPVNPLSVYGTSKLAAEEAVLKYPANYVVRTGWVYAEHGTNFVKTMLRLGQERSELGVVADQVGTPTYARHLAEMLWQLVRQRPQARIYHFSDAGVASWYDFAEAIFEESIAVGLLITAPRVTPLTTTDYPTPAKRPAYSVLDKTQTWSDLGIIPVHWRKALNAMLVRLSALNH